MKHNKYLTPATDIMLLSSDDLLTHAELMSKGMKTNTNTPGLAPGRKLPLIVH